ncbi:thiol:disulfide interchange protein, partial [Lactobacillus delbrueckii subsp. bulgaricus]
QDIHVGTMTKKEMEQKLDLD